MGIESSMKELAQSIASSRQDRAKRLGEIKGEASQTREEARDLIKGFQASRKEMKAELNEASAAWQGLGKQHPRVFGVSLPRLDSKPGIPPKVN